jgi:hypothetical protein
MENMFNLVGELRFVAEQLFQINQQFADSILRIGKYLLELRMLVLNNQLGNYDWLNC